MEENEDTFRTYKIPSEESLSKLYPLSPSIGDD